jgi:hypothetical protein
VNAQFDLGPDGLILAILLTMDELARLSENARATVRRSGLPDSDGNCVVYWMQRSRRALDNPALEVAIFDPIFV